MLLKQFTNERNVSHDSCIIQSLVEVEEDLYTWNHIKFGLEFIGVRSWTQSCSENIIFYHLLVKMYLNSFIQNWNIDGRSQDNGESWNSS